MTDLVKKQIIFMDYISHLLNEFTELSITAGDFYRSPEEAKRLAKLGTGVEFSAHCLRLAADFIIRKPDGTESTDKSDYLALGEYWKQLPALYERDIQIVTCWGGDFTTRDDFYHYSILHNGIR